MSEIKDPDVIGAYRKLAYIKRQRAELDALERESRTVIDEYTDDAMPRSEDSMLFTIENRPAFTYRRTRTRQLNRTKLRRDFEGIYEACIEVKTGTRLELAE